jgi:hypothetical protein
LLARGLHYHPLFGFHSSDCSHSTGDFSCSHSHHSLGAACESHGHSAHCHSHEKARDEKHRPTQLRSFPSLEADDCPVCHFFAKGQLLERAVVETSATTAPPYRAVSPTLRAPLSIVLAYGARAPPLCVG